MVKARKRKLPGIYMLLTLVAIATALGFYGNKVVVQPSGTTTTSPTTTPVSTETASQVTTALPLTNETVSVTPITKTPTTNVTASRTG
ncbi:MAG: hypothetical protein LM571_00350 [Desulfurococcaceae archaeon]|nr:hypothetical protein [Desulfurococcaceae archaeon]